MKIFAKVHGQNLLHGTTFLKVAFIFSEEFQRSLSAKIYFKYRRRPYQLLDKKMAVVFLNFR